MEIHSLARYGDVEGMRRWLDAGASIDQLDGESRTPLMVAAESPRAGADMLRLLLERGADPNAASNDGYTALRFASKSGDLEKVRCLTDAGADPDYRNENNYSALIDAAYSSSPEKAEVIRLLLSLGVDPNVVTSYGESPVSVAFHLGNFEIMDISMQAGLLPGPQAWNPLMQAVAFGTLDAMIERIQQGDNPNEPMQYGGTPWQLSLQMGHLEKAQYLLDHGATMIDDDLFLVVTRDNPDVVRWLIDLGANPNAVDQFRHSVLHVAAERGSTECVRVLIAAGADVNADDFVESKPLHDAVNPEIARLIVAAGADINAISGEGYSRLKYAAERGELDMARTMLALGADVDAEQKRYSTETPLYRAVLSDDLEMARLLIEAGADPNAQQCDGWFPLSNAESIEMAKLLLDAGADIHLTDEMGKDALEYQQDPDVAAFLIAQGAQVNPQESIYGSSLREAARDNNLPKVQLLIRHGANLDGQMTWGETALMTAAESVYVDIVRVLLDAGANTEMRDEHGRTAIFYAAAPEGFTSYKLMKEHEGRSMRDSFDSESFPGMVPMFDLLESIGIDLTSHNDYGYVCSDSVEVIEMLLAAGADINTRDKTDMTALMLAASCGRPARVAALLRLGADDSLRDRSGKSAFDHAQAHPEADQREEIVRLLEQYRA